MIIGDLVGGILHVERRQCHTLRIARPIGFIRKLLRPRYNRILEFRFRHAFIDDVPLDRPLAAHAFRCRAEIIRPIMAYLALVDQPRQTAGAGQHGQQRQFGKRYGRGAVIDQHDVIGGKGELVTATGCRAVDRAKIGLVGVFRRVLDTVTGLVGEFAEIDLVIVGRQAKHADIGAGAKDVRLVRAHDHGANLGMFEAQTLDRIVQLNIDAEIVGIQLELITGLQGRRLGHIHGQ